MRKDLQDMYEKNIKIFKEQEPDLAKKIEKLKIDKKKFKIVEQGELFNIKMGKKLYYGEDMQETLRKSWGHQRGTFQKLAICYGLGLGYDIAAFLSYPRINKICSFLIIIEEDLEIIKLCMHVADFEDLYKKFIIHFIYEKSQNVIQIKLADFLTKYGETKLFIKAFCELFSDYAYNNEGYYIKVKTLLSQSFRDNIIMYGNSILDSLEGFKNMLDNIVPTIENPGITKLRDKFKGKTAILVAAGPSLQKNIEQLKDMRDKCFIICVDSALKPLLRAGIYPHMVTAIERGLGPIAYYQDIDEYLPELRRKTIFAPATILRKEIYDLVVNQYKLKCMVVFRDFAHYKWLNIDRGIIKSGKSSANLAFKMLKEMGFSKMLLVGQDLAFGENNQTHISGADHSIEGMKKSHKIKKELFVKGNYVDKIKTLAVWDSFRRFYQTDIQEYSGKVYNCTEGGAFIYGTTILTLKEGIEKHVKPYDVQKILDCCLLTTPEQCDKDATEVKTAYKNALEFVRYARKNIQKIEDAIAHYNYKCNSKEKFKNIDKEFTRATVHIIDRTKVDIWNHKQFYLFFTHISQSFNIAFETDVNSLFSLYRDLHDYWLTYIIVHRYWVEAMNAFTDCTMKYFKDAIDIFNNNYGESHGKISVEKDLS